MNNCSILVADDEAPLREFLLDLIEKLWPEVGQVHQAVNGVDALKKIIQHKPDVAFLDINMPGMSGIEVAAQCADDCHVVFVTAYDQFAIEAFENNAVDYLLKPVSEQRLQQTLARLENRMQSHPASLESVIEQLSKEKRNLNWLKVAHKEQIKLIKTEEVDFFQSADKYTSAYSDGAEYILRTSLKQLEQHIDKQEVKRGQTLVKIQKDIGKTRDITGGLPRVAELFEARMPTNPAVVTEINGTVKFGETNRGIRKMTIESRDGESRSYKIPYGKHVIVHEGDFITAGTPLCEGAISPTDILSILGPGAVREYLVNEIQEVYRLQGVGINDKHIEVIVRQMMKKIMITDPGNSRFLESERVDRVDLAIENERLSAMAIVGDPGASDWEEGALIEKLELRETNKELKEAGSTPIKTHKTQPATYDPLLMGITQASLNTESYLSAASFQETTRVLTDAATAGKTDYLRGLKENVVIGRLIPAGTGYPALQDISLDIKEKKKVEPLEISIDEML